MRKSLLHRYLLALGIVVAGLTVVASVWACVTSASASGSLDCNGVLTINVSGFTTGGNITSGSYSVTINGQLFTGTIPINVDSSGNFTGSVTTSVGALTGNVSVSGTVTVADSGPVNITFTPNTLSCSAANCPARTQLGAAGGFALLALNGGSMIINSATSIVGDVGYSAQVTSTTNQKVGSFTGTAYVHSTADFVYTPATFQPSGGIVRGGAADTLLNQANANVATAASFYNGLSSNGNLGSVTGNLNLTANSSINVFDASTWNYNSNTLTLDGDAKSVFVFRVSGSFNWSQSQTQLNGVQAANVIFFFPNASLIDINKSTNVFAGTVLAPTGSAIYHNPATFNGAIIAKSIDVHSDFNISLPPCPAQ